MLNITDVLEMDFKDEIADSSPLKTRSIPLDILFDEDASLKPSTILGKLICSELNIFKISIPITKKNYYFF